MKDRNMTPISGDIEISGSDEHGGTAVILKARQPSVLRRLWGRILYIIFRSDVSLVELLMGGWYVSVIRTLWFSDPNLIANNPSYASMASIWPQWFWGLAFAVVGLVKVTGVLMRGVVIGKRLDRASEVMRFTGAVLGTGLWFMWAAVLSQVNVPVPGLLGFWILGVTCLLTAVRHTDWLVAVIRARRRATSGAGHRA